MLLLAPLASIGAERQCWRMLCRCAFSNCQHLAEPGCAVRDGWSRHAWYTELHAEVKAGREICCATVPAARSGERFPPA